MIEVIEKRFQYLASLDIETLRKQHLHFMNGHQGVTSQEVMEMYARGLITKNEEDYIMR
jgi:hypothetical protein